jgi:hypothetical protein
LQFGDLIEQALKELHEGEKDKASKTLFEYTLKNLNNGIDKGAGVAKFGEPNYEFNNQLKHNAAVFSAFKTHHQSADLVRALSNPDGSLKGYAAFRKDALAISKDYNENHLRTEYNHAVRSSRMAARWQDFQRNKHLYPYLEYLPSRAANQRDEHKHLYGVIKHIDDPFWDTWLPPNDWGCKCDVRQVSNDAGTRAVPDDIKLPVEAMRNNPGKTEQVFSDKNPYVKKAKDKATVLEKADKMERDFIRKEVAEYAIAAYAEKSFLIDGKQTFVPTRGIRKAIAQNHNQYNLKNKAIESLPIVFKRAKYENSLLPYPESRRVNIEKTLFYKFEMDGQINYIVVWQYRKTGTMEFHSIIDQEGYKELLIKNKN